MQALLQGLYTGMLNALGMGLAAFGMATTSPGYDADNTGNGAPCHITLKVYLDGSWAVLPTPGAIFTGSPVYGRWANGPVDPSEFELQFTTANLVNTPTIVNGSSSYAQMDKITSRTCDVAKSANGVTASADVTMNIRRIGTTTPVFTGTTNFGVTGGGAGGGTIDTVFA